MKILNYTIAVLICGILFVGCSKDDVEPTKPRFIYLDTIFSGDTTKVVFSKENCKINTKYLTGENYLFS